MGAFFDWLLSNSNGIITVIVILAVAIPSLTVVRRLTKMCIRDRIEYFSHNLSCFLVNKPFIRVRFIFLVAVWNNCC